MGVTLNFLFFFDDYGLAKKYNDSGLPLEILLSNAGVAFHSLDWVTTDDGYEITYVIYKHSQQQQQQ